jgi:BirA family biotin operon repressor/biotin-[acetyl-CoA-carboxylase] ligase
MFFDKLDSTSLEAKRLIARGGKGKHVIVAAEQLLGQGRSGNSWHSPQGNLYCSLVFDHKHDLAKLSQISLVTSLSCFEVMQELGEASEPSLFPRSFKIKWPNDLLLNGKKFCGILLQAFSQMDAASKEIVNYLVIGIGINLISSPNNHINAMKEYQAPFSLSTPPHASSQRKLGSSTYPSESWDPNSSHKAGSSGQARGKGLDPSLRWDDAGRVKRFQDANASNQVYPTTSLKEEGVRYGSLNEVLHRLMERFNENYKLWQKKGFSDIRARWIQNAHNLGAKAQIKVMGERISGLFKDIDEEGQMILETESGVLRKVITCDVQFG